MSKFFKFINEDNGTSDDSSDGQGGGSQYSDSNQDDSVARLLKKASCYDTPLDYLKWRKLKAWRSGEEETVDKAISQLEGDQ